MLIFVHGIIHFYMCPWLYTVFSIYFFIYAFIYLYLSIHSLSISTFFIIYLLRFVLILHAHRSCRISPILGPQVSHPQPGRSGSPASQSSARRERNGKAIAALGACGACRRPLQRADPRPPRLGDVARDGQVRWWKSTKGRKVKMKMKAGKKNAIPARFCHLWVAIPFQTWKCFQTFPNNSKDPARTCARTLGRHRVIEKGKPGQRRGYGYPNLECLWNMAAAAWLEYMKKKYLIKSFNDQIAGCQLQTLSLFCGTLGESSKHNLALCCQKNRISHSAPQRNRNLQVWSLQHDPKFQG